MRTLVLAASLLLSAACYRDNASPFVHGPRNDPSKGTGSRGALASSESEPGSTAATTTNAYGDSTGQAGGMNTTTNPQQSGMQQTTPQTGAAQTATEPVSR